LSAFAAVAGAAGRGVPGDDAVAVGDAAKLVTEGRRRLARQQRVAAAKGLLVGAVGERHLDLHEHVAWAGLGSRHVLDPQVAGGVQERRLHGVKTTLSTSPRR